MQIRNVMIDNIHYINFNTFNISTLIFVLICPAKTDELFIHLCVLYAFKYGNLFAHR